MVRRFGIMRMDRRSGKKLIRMVRDTVYGQGGMIMGN
jgi:hypothetical protein